MKAPNKIDIIPETLQKEFHDFISNNATFLFGTTDNHYEHVVKLKDLYMGKAKIYKELVKSYQSQFLNLLLADNFDKIAVAKLFQDSFIILVILVQSMLISHRVSDLYLRQGKYVLRYLKLIILLLFLQRQVSCRQISSGDLSLCEHVLPPVLIHNVGK